MDVLWFQMCFLLILWIPLQQILISRPNTVLIFNANNKLVLIQTFQKVLKEAMEHWEVPLIMSSVLSDLFFNYYNKNHCLNSSKIFLAKVLLSSTLLEL